MASYYDKILSNNKKGQPKHSKRLISLDDSLAEEQDNKPNIFNEPTIQVSKQTVQNKNEQQKQKQKAKKGSVAVNKGQAKNKKQNSEANKEGNKIQRSTVLKNEEKRVIDKRLPVVNEGQFQEMSIEEPEVHGVSKKSWLSILQSFKLLLGHYFYSYNFPIPRQIPIIANNLDLEREKYENGTYISQSFDNNLQVSFFLFFLRSILIQNFLRLSVILWILALILSFVIYSDEQYRPGRQILLGIFLFYCVVTVILQYFSLKGRRDWFEPSSNIKYRVYHYDNQTRTAQWVATDVADLRPGNIYKVPAPSLSKPSTIPADSILLHGPRTILQINETPVLQFLSPLQKQQRISLKQTVIKQDVILLPLTGVIHYQLAAPEIVEQNIYGRFILQQPSQQTLSISYNNVALRGTQILSSQILLTDDNNKSLEQKESEILAVVLETGIDSLVLKTSQYPYQYRDHYTYAKLIDNLLIICSILYLLITGAGILIGYIYLQGKTITLGSHISKYLNLGETPISFGEIILHHFGNLIIITPLLIRISYLIFINISGRRVGKKINVTIKDMHILSQAREPEVLITTIGSDLIRMGHNKYAKQGQNENENIFESIEQGRSSIRNRSLQSIRVSGIHHNFLTTSIESSLYSTKDVDMICYFMSLALLTCNRKDPTPLEGGIIERCNKQLNVKIQKVGSVIKIGQLRVIKIFTIPPTQRYPYKIVFYRHGKDIVEDLQNNDKYDYKQKVLCLIRGETTRLMGKLNEVDSHLLSQFSNRLHQEKGYHIELLGKFVLSYDDFLEVKKAYLSTDQPKDNESKNQSIGVGKIEQSRASSASKRYKFSIQKFYQNLDRYMLKVDPMGVLIWQNPYNVISSSLPISSLAKPKYKIIIAPPSKSLTNPEFESIHAITNYLLKTSKLSLKQISNKILHNYTSKETFWSLLRAQKILVLNGWDYRVIKKMMTDLKQLKREGKNSLKFLSYIEQDEYAWVLKESDISISTKGDGHDLQKYSDILISSQTSSTTTEIIGKIFLYAQAYSYCIGSIIIIQFMKSILLATIEFINNFYTWGTGLVIIGTPLYLVLQIGILLDFLYFLFPNLDQNEQGASQARVQSRQKSRQVKNRQEKKGLNNEIKPEHIAMEILSGIAVGCFITFMCIYSMTEPPTKSGTVEPKQFTNLLIHFIMYHVLVFRKIFMAPYNFSIYKLFIIVVQIAVYYIGILIVSAVDYYQYKGVIWYIISGKIILIAIFTVWMVVGVYWLAFMIQSMLVSQELYAKNNNYQKIKPPQNKKLQQNSVENDIKVGEPVDIQ